MSHEAPKKYNVATLLDMARIPPDRIPAFIAELPRLLEEIRPLIAFMDSEMTQGQVELIAEKLIWVDDGIADGSADVKTITFRQKRV